MTATKVALVAATLIPGVALAEMYRWVDPDGRVTYADRPPAQALPFEPRADLKLLIPETAASETGASEAEAVRSRFRARLAALEAAQGEIVAAEAALRAAEAERERGVEPLPGERLGIRTGYSRLAPAYHERQARLEEAVRAARARLDAAHANRNALR